MLKITRTGEHTIYGQRVMRDGDHVGYVGKDDHGKWACKPLQGRMTVARKLRKEALADLEAQLLQADELARQEAAFEADQAEAAAALEDRMAAQDHEDALLEAE